MFGVVGTALALFPVLNFSETSGTYRGGTWKNTGEEYRRGKRRPAPSYFNYVPAVRVILSCLVSDNEFKQYLKFEVLGIVRALSGIDNGVVDIWVVLTRPDKFIVSALISITRLLSVCSLCLNILLH